MTLKVSWLLVPDRLFCVSENAGIYWDIQTQPSLEITENGPQKTKYPVDGNCVDENVLSGYVRGQMRMDSLIQDD